VTRISETGPWIARRVAAAACIGWVSSVLVGCPVTPVSNDPCDAPGAICTVAGTGKSQFDGDGRDALDTSFYLPLDVEFDPQGRPLILDFNNLRVRRINEDGTIETIMGLDFEAPPTEGALAVETPLHHASDIEFDASGNLYVAGDHAPIVFRVGLDQRVTIVAGSGDSGYAGDGGPALAARLTTPFGVLPDRRGGFYVSDLDAHVVRYVDAGGIIRTAVGSGTAGYSGDGGPATAARLRGPTRMALGLDGSLYVCDTDNHCIRRVDADGVIETICGTGTPGYSGDGGPATAALLNRPHDLAIGPDGALYVADTDNNVIRRLDADGAITTVVGTGAAGFSGDGGSAGACTLNRPSGVTVAADGALWVSDAANQRVRRVAAVETR
jgi:hypothetical protein